MLALHGVRPRSRRDGPECAQNCRLHVIAPAKHIWWCSLSNIARRRNRDPHCRADWPRRGRPEPSKPGDKSQHPVRHGVPDPVTYYYSNSGGSVEVSPGREPGLHDSTW